MSDLQLGLLAIGIAVVIAVIGYNKWQEVRLRRKTEGAFASSRDDVLMHQGAAAEPTDFDQPPAAEPRDTGSPAIERAPERVEHTIGDVDVEPAVPAAQPQAEPARLRPAVLDADIDFIVGLDCAKPVSGRDVAAKAEALVDEGMLKPVHWEGYDAALGAWQAIVPEQRYAQLRAGLQLVNRSGPVTADDLSAFVAEMQEVALSLAALPEFPDVNEALQQAGAIDGFCAEVDVQMGLSVLSGAGHMLQGTKIRALAESAGLVLGKDGRYHRYNEAGAELFALANLEPMPFHPETIKTLSTHGVTVLLDVPRAPGVATTFRSYVEFARHLADAVSGTLVDDNRKPISQPALDQIAAQLDVIHRNMASQGMPAGSPLALRLFS